VIQRTIVVLIIGYLIAAAAFGSDGVPLTSVENRWSIGVYAGPSPVALAPRNPQPVFTADRVTDIEARFVADPFLVRQDGRWHLFFEAFNAITSQGDIALATSDDAARWDYQRVVLDEPFHLSYPYVFEADGAYYMVPECASLQSIRLYRASQFPTRWQFVATLVSGTGVVDPSVLYTDGRWWMFASAPGDAALYAYYADRPEGPWLPHAANPIVRDAPDHARPGGRVLPWNERVIRFAQDDATSYGTSVSAYEITTLTTEQYSERPVSPPAQFRASDRGWNSAGMHHVDVHQAASESWIAAVDGSERVLMLGRRRLPLWPSWGRR
jgi:hypothetical protein